MNINLCCFCSRGPAASTTDIRRTPARSERKECIYYPWLAHQAGQRDTVSDFFRMHGDLLDFSGIDADGNAANGDTAFQFIGTAAFSAVGQLRYSFEGSGTVIEINTAGTSGSEMQVLLTNGTTALIASDFLL